MPIFKMKCRKCGAVFEALFKTASPTVLCENCNSDDLEKLPSEIAVLNKSNSCPNAPVCPSGGCCGGHCGGHL